jgi:hypothetical protein
LPLLHFQDNHNNRLQGIHRYNSNNKNAEVRDKEKGDYHLQVTDLILIVGKGKSQEWAYNLNNKGHQVKDSRLKGDQVEICHKQIKECQINLNRKDKKSKAQDYHKEVIKKG